MINNIIFNLFSKTRSKKVGLVKFEIWVGSFEIAEEE